MNVFQLYVGQVHLFSLVAVGLVMIVGMYLTRKYPIHISTIMSLITVVLGHFVYEDFFIWIMGMTGRGTEALTMFLLMTTVFMLCMYILQKHYKFLSMNGLIITVFLSMQLIVLFTGMWVYGWFHELQLWYTGQGPDPHNGLWAISKVLGFAMFIPLLWRKD